MEREWKSAKLGDYFDLIGGYAFKSEDFTESGVPVVKIKNVKSNRMLYDHLSYVDPEFLQTRSDKIIKRGDLLITMSGNRLDGTPGTWVGKVAQFNEERPHLLNQRVGILRPKGGKEVSRRFFSYSLSSHFYQNEFIAIATSSGGQANLSPSQILGAPIEVPPLSQQKAIAAVLGALDDKIELNRRMNATLEAMARALFQSWFVDFDPVRAKLDGRQPAGLDPATAALFSNEFEDSELGPIPKGWRGTNLGAVVEVFDWKRVPLSGREREQRRGPYPYYGAASVMDYVDDYLFDGVYMLMGEDGSVINQDGTPVTQYVWGKFWVNNHAHVLRGKNSISTEHLLLHLSRTNISAFVTGAVQPKLNQANMNRIEFILPSSEVAKAFANIVEPFFTQIRSNIDQSRTLATIRDTLLPKLLSGAVKPRNVTA